MATITTGNIRNVCLRGHGGCGKTSIAEAMLFEAKDIDRMVNIDQVGGTEAPLKSRRPDYLMMLSEPENGRRDALLIANMSPEVSLDVAFDYYGSKDFTRVFFRTISDQKPFLDNGIPSVMFTSGITLRNNKANDTADSLDYGILRRRVLAMFYYLVRVI